MASPAIDPALGEPGPAVRRATPADALAAARLLHDFNTEFATPTPGTVVLTRRLEHLLAGDTTVALLAGEPELGIAVITFRPNVWYDGPVALLDELYVVPRARGQGVGGELLAAVVALVREREGGLVEINVDERDTDARRFYARHGFSDTETGTDERALYVFRDLTGNGGSDTGGAR